MRRPCHNGFHSGVLAWTLLASSGCAVGPAYSPPQTPPVAQVTASALPPATNGAPGETDRAQQFVDAQSMPAKWWQSFGSPEIDGLVEHALQKSPTIASAQAALRQAEESALAQRGAFWPSVQADYAPVRARSAQVLSSPLNSGASLYTLQTGQLSVGYVFDLFGANQRSVESLDAQRESQRWQLEAAKLSLAANVATAALQWASLREQFEVTEQLQSLAQDQLELMGIQRRLGEIPGATVVAQEALVAQAQAASASIAKALAQQHDGLAMLTGYVPSQLEPLKLRLADLHLPDVPTGLPARILRQRPDVRAAESTVRAANAQVGVAVANMLPQLSLNANYGTSAVAFSQLFSAAGVFWALGANLAQPVFDGGTLLHRKRASEAQLEQSLAQYQGTVLIALQNYADSLEAARHDADQAVATLRQEQRSRAALDIARRQLEIGDVSRLTLLNTESGYLQSALSRIQSQTNRLVDVCAVYVALGGGWQGEAGESTLRSPPD